MVESKKTILSNGVRLLSERHPTVPAVHLGFWFMTGTRDEPTGQQGISHLLEHFVFKGTKKRNSYEIALSLEAVGGELNAFTTKEYTCYHTVSLAEHLDLSIDVLADLVFGATLPIGEFEKEKKVVIQEISMAREDYSEHIYDVFMKNCFRSNAMGTPILGNKKSITALARKDVRAYMQGRYNTENLVITVVGALDHKKLVQKFEKRLKAAPRQGVNVVRESPQFTTFQKRITCPSEQTHVLMGFPTASLKDPDRYESYFVSTLLGGGMTSRLYQKLRERYGLAYSVYAYLYTFLDSALSYYYVATEKKNATRSMEMVVKELKSLRKNGLQKSDLELYRTQMRGHLLLASDDLENRMMNLAYNEMIFGRQRTIAEIVKEIDQISLGSLHAYIERYVDPDRISSVTMGDLRD